MKYTSFIEQVLVEASDIATEMFGNVSIQVKPEDNNQILTEADIRIGAHIVNRIQEIYTDHNIIDEEAGVIDKGSDYTWVVDPIDGTSNFSSQLPHFGIMVGLLKDNKPIAGGAALPAFAELYLAEKGCGTTCNGRAVSVTSETNLSNILLAYGIDGHREDPQRTQKETAQLTEVILAIRNLRTSNSVFDMAMVAAGKYGAYINQTTKVWDNVAAEILITEAGGVFSDLAGVPVDYTHCLSEPDKNYQVIGTSPALHDPLLHFFH